MTTMIEDIFLSTGGDDESSDFIPLITDGEESFVFKKSDGENILILPLRNMVLFPGVILPISLGRKKSLFAAKEAYKHGALLGVFTQKESNDENPMFDSLYNTGTVAQVLKILEMPDGSTSAILQGKKRIALNEILSDEPLLRGSVTELEDVMPIKKFRKA